MVDNINFAAKLIQFASLWETSASRENINKFESKTQYWRFCEYGNGQCWQ